MRDIPNIEAIFIGLQHRKDLYHIIKALPDDTPFHIWIHLGRYLDNKKYEGTRLFKRLKRKDFLPYIKARFVSSDRNRSVQIDNENTILLGYADINDSHKLEKINVKPYYKYEILNHPTHHRLDYEYSLQTDDLNPWIFETQMQEEKINLGHILYEVFKDRKVENIIVEVLTQGYSGAHAVAINYQAYNIQKQMVLKIAKQKGLLNKEKQFTQRVAGSHLQNINYIQCQQDYVLGDWHILCFEKINHHVLLKTQLNKSSEELIRQYFSKLVIQTKDQFEKDIGNLKIVKNTNIWDSNKPQQYKGLALNPDKKRNIAREANTIFKAAPDIFTDKEKTNFINFIKENTYKGIPIAKHLNIIPTATIHGDLHSGNIFTTNSGDSFKIIDFAAFKEHSHAFLDLAKLSIDVEFNILDDRTFLFNSQSFNNIEKWIECHKAWFSHLINRSANSYQINKEHSFDQLLEKTYNINNFIVLSIQEHYTQLRDTYGEIIHISLKELCQHFILTRLHYLLKFISYKSYIIEKRCFALRASIDILEFFYKKY